jgi:hypothetical protein
MASISIPDPLLERIKANAAARQLSLDAYLNDIVARDATTRTNHVAQLAAWNAFVSGMTQWSRAHLPAGYVADDSRESIYEGRGE